MGPTPQPRPTSGSTADRPDHARHIDYVELGELEATPGNPKTHDLPGLAVSIARFGFTDPCLEDARTGRLVIGHGRLDAVRALHALATGTEPAGLALPAHARDQAREHLTGPDEQLHAPDGIVVTDDGRWHIPVVRGWASRDDDHARGLIIAANKLAENGGWDEQLLPEWLADLTDADAELLAATGFTVDEVDAMNATGQHDDTDPAITGDEDDDEDDEDDLFPGAGEREISIRVDIGLYHRWRRLLDGYAGDTDAERLEALIDDLDEGDSA